MSDTPRIHAQERELVPRAMVRAMFALVMICLLMVSAHVWSGRPLQATPPQSAITAERAIYLKGDMAGAVRVLDSQGTLLVDLAPDQGGFISGVWRVLQRERTKARVALDGPVLLSAFENGRMAITDPSTGWSADLMGFGRDNASAFARLLKP